MQASHSFVCEHHRTFLHNMRAKRKRKDSEEENDYQPEVGGPGVKAAHFYPFSWFSEGKYSIPHDL